MAKYRKVEKLLCRLSVLALMPAAAIAQGSGGSSGGSVAPGDPSAAASADLGDILVTARRRSESLQSVPVAVTAITAKTIAEAGIVGVADFVKFVPNVTFSNALSGGTNYLTLRGQTQAQYEPPPAAIVVDGVLTISPLQFNVDDFNLQQIEVLKGPQGAYYGRNAIAGAINITTYKPGNDLVVKGLLGYANGETYKARLLVGGPIIEDRLMIGASVSYTDRRGQILDRTTDHYIDNYDNLTGHVRVVAKPNETTEVDVRYTYAKTNGYDPTYGFSLDGDPNGNGDRGVLANRIGHASNRINDLSGRLSVELGYGTVVATLAYVNAADVIQNNDFDFTALDLAYVASVQRERGFSQELRFISPQDRPFRWMVGAYHLRNRRQINGNVFVDPGLFFPPLTGVASAQLQQTVDINHYQNYSAFAQAEYDITSALEIAVAARYDHDDDDQAGFNSGTPVDCNGALPGIRCETKFKKLQPKATLTYKANRDLLIYGSVGQGFRAGNFNSTARSFGNSVVNAETATSYEIGVKSQWFDRRLTINGAAFYTNLKNGQFKLFDARGATLVGINIDKTRIQGFEIEANGHISHRLTVTTGFGYTDEKIKKFVLPANYAGPTGTFVGNRPPRVPDYTLNVGFSYEQPLNDDISLFLRPNYNRVGSYYWDALGINKRGAVNSLDLRFGVGQAQDRWTVTGWVKNALNDRKTGDYQAAAFSGQPFGYSAYYPTVGTTYGVELGFRL